MAMMASNIKNGKKDVLGIQGAEKGPLFRDTL